MDKKFPGFEDVLVTKEQIVPNRFYNENNLVYNIFLVINFREHGIEYIDKMHYIKNLIEETIRVELQIELSSIPIILTKIKNFFLFVIPPPPFLFKVFHLSL